MNKLLKWILVINVAILIAVIIKFVFFNKSGEWIPPPLVDNTDKILIEADSIKATEKRIDSLKTLIVEKENIIVVKNESLTKLKKDYEIKKHSVAILPADESISFFAEYISRQ